MSLTFYFLSLLSLLLWLLEAVQQALYTMNCPLLSNYNISMQLNRAVVTKNWENAKQYDTFQQVVQTSIINIVYCPNNQTLKSMLLHWSVCSVQKSRNLVQLLCHFPHCRFWLTHQGEELNSTGSRKDPCAFTKAATFAFLATVRLLLYIHWMEAVVASTQHLKAPVTSTFPRCRVTFIHKF